MSDLERSKEQDPDRGDNSYLFFALGVGLIAATVMIILTTGEAVTGFPFVIGAAALIGIGLSKTRGRRPRAAAAPVDHERELLSAIRDNGGSITPAEAALETSLTVREADRMLSELAGGGHLAVESRGGSLFYALPNRSTRELGQDS